MALHLRCADTSAVLDLSDDRFPVVRCWGPDLGDVSGDDLSDAALAAETSLGINTVWITNDLPILPLAHPGWNSCPAVTLSHVDGSAFSPHPTAFTHEEDSEDTPAGTTLIVRSSGTDTAHELTLGTELHLEACGLVRLHAWVHNDRPESDDEQGADLVVGELTPVLPLPDSADELLDTTGHHVQERRLVRTPSTPGTHLRESWEGRPGHDAVTWLAANPTGFGRRSGRVHGVHAARSDNVRHLAMNPVSGRRLPGTGELFLSGEISLAPGQTYTSPWTVFSWGEGLDALAQRSHAWLRSHPSHPARPRPVLLNTWEAVHFDHDLDKPKALADTAVQVGIERYVLDDGWFGSHRDDILGLGDWQVSPEARPNGLEPLVEHVHALGMEFGLWFEPEMVNVDSDVARAHPEWILFDGTDGAPGHRHQRVLDLSAPGARDYLSNAISTLVERLDITYLKWDHNSPLLATGREVSDPTAGHPEAAAVHDQTLAVYRLLDTLYERFPSLKIESCVGGGGRIDLGIMERTQRVWASDCIDAHDRQNIQHGTALLLPPEMVGTHVDSRRVHTTLRDLDLDFRAGTTLWGHIGVEWDLTETDDATRERLASIIALHKELRDLLRSGVTVHADLPDDDVLRIEGAVAPDGSDTLFEIASLGQLLA